VGVVEAVEIVKVEEQVGPQLPGLKEAIAPPGNPETTEKLTGSVRPEVRLAVAVVEAEPP